MREIYDVVTKQTIIFENGKFAKKCKELNIEYTALSKVFSENLLAAQGRYILHKNKDKIFTLVDYDTGKEYDCIANKTIFTHFSLPVVENEIKYIYELFRKRQHYASICGRVFYLKEHGCDNIRQPNSKNNSKKLDIMRRDNKIRKRLYSSLLNRVNGCLKSKSIKKFGHTEELVGCKIEFLIGYLEAQFTKGMTWENHRYNGWHIDHIKPCEDFNLNDEKEQKECFHYTNLRPLWSTTKVAIQHGEGSNYIGNQNRM